MMYDDDVFKDCLSSGLWNSFCSYFDGIGITEKDKDPYLWADKKCKFYCYSLLSDGVWNSRGDMGWFGVSRNETNNWQEQFKSILDSISEETVLAIVDCHI